MLTGPSLKPQALLRKLVYAALPLGEGVVCDPFMGSGSTLAAANAMGINAVGVERRKQDVDQCKEVITKLAALSVDDAQLELIA